MDCITEILGLIIGDTINRCNDAIASVKEPVQLQKCEPVQLDPVQTKTTVEHIDGDTYITKYTHISNYGVMNITIGDNGRGHKYNDNNYHSNDDDYYRRREEIERDARMKFYKANSF